MKSLKILTAALWPLIAIALYLSIIVAAIIIVGIKQPWV